MKKEKLTDLKKLKVIETFLKKLGTVKGKGFTTICNFCKSDNVEIYDSVGCGSEYTGCWGSAGVKCKDCGNAEEIINF